MAGFTTNKTHKAAFAATRRRVLVMGTASAALCLFPVLAGCSGGSKKDAPDSDYVGSYRAAYTIPGVNENGTFSYSVAQKGDMVGSFVDTSSNATRAFSGHVNNNGTFSGTTIDADGTTKFSTNGTLSKVVSASTGGDFRQERNGKTFSGSFSYVTTGVTAPTSNVKVGAYNGFYVLTGQTPGPASFSIDRNGNITGFVTTNGETGALTGSAANNASFSGTIVYPSGQATIAGTLITTDEKTFGGNFVQTKNGAATPGKFAVSLEVSEDSPFTGAYSGSFNLSGQGAGPASYSVDKQGEITGFVSTGGETGILTGQVTGSGTFTGTISYSSGQATIGGTLATTTNGQPSGNFTQTKGGVSTPGNFGGPVALPADSPFTGSYSGSFNIPGQLAGPASYSVDKQGGITGLVTTNNEVGTLRGQVTSTGTFTGTITYPSGQATIGGTLSTTTDGTTAGNFTQTKGSATSPGSFGGPTSLTANSPLIGSYQGTYGVPDKNETGTLSLTVDISGKLLGSFDKGNTTPLGVFSGSMSADGNFAGTISYPAANGSAQYPTRTISGKMSTQQGGTADPADKTKLQGDFVVDNGNSDGQPTAKLPGSFDVTRTNPKGTINLFRGTFLQSATPLLKPFLITGSPAGITAQSGLSITVDQEGRFIGFLDDGTRLEGYLYNDGRLIATATPVASITGYALTGKASLQQVSVDNTDYTKDPVVPNFGKSAGIAANFQVNINGTNYPGVFTATGGFQSGQ